MIAQRHEKTNELYGMIYGVDHLKGLFMHIFKRKTGQPLILIDQRERPDFCQESMIKLAERYGFYIE